MTDTHDTDQPEILHRTYTTDMTAGDGRTVDVRIVPYGEQITHNDGRGGLPKGVPYQEVWESGAFSDQARAAEVGRAKHVLLNFEHEEGLRGVVGHGLTLREAADGLYGSFTIHAGPDGDKALMLVQEGVLTGISLEARSKKSVRNAAGLVRRVKAVLVNVALCREGAYEGARVLAIREPAMMLDEELLPHPFDPDLAERLERLGLTVPDNLKAPPDMGTPAGAGTRRTANTKP